MRIHSITSSAVASRVGGTVRPFVPFARTLDKAASGSPPSNLARLSAMPLKPLRTGAAHVVQLRSIWLHYCVHDLSAESQEKHPQTPPHSYRQVTGTEGGMGRSKGDYGAAMWNEPGENWRMELHPIHNRQHPPKPSRGIALPTGGPATSHDAAATHPADPGG
jgi:hypothetical protein